MIKKLYVSIIALCVALGNLYGSEHNEQSYYAYPLLFLGDTRCKIDKSPQIELKSNMSFEEIRQTMTLKLITLSTSDLSPEEQSKQQEELLKRTTLGRIVKVPDDYNNEYKIDKIDEKNFKKKDTETNLPYYVTANLYMPCSFNKEGKRYEYKYDSNASVYPLQVTQQEDKSNEENSWLAIQKMNGSKLYLNIDETSTIGALKQLIFEKEGIAPQSQRIIFSGKQPGDNQVLEDYGIKKLDKPTLHLVRLLRNNPHTNDEVLAIEKKRIAYINHANSTKTAPAHFNQNNKSIWLQPTPYLLLACCCIVLAVVKFFPSPKKQGRSKKPKKKKKKGILKR